MNKIYARTYILFSRRTYLLRTHIVSSIHVIRASEWNEGERFAKSRESDSNSLSILPVNSERRVYPPINIGRMYREPTSTKIECALKIIPPYRQRMCCMGLGSSVQLWLSNSMPNSLGDWSLAAGLWRVGSFYCHALPRFSLLFFGSRFHVKYNIIKCRKNIFFFFCAFDFIYTYIHDIAVKYTYIWDIDIINRYSYIFVEYVIFL